MPPVLRSGSTDGSPPAPQHGAPTTSGAKRKRVTPPSSAAPLPHNSKKLVAETLGEELSCAVCFNLLCAPHALPCGHTFCGACLWEHARKSANLASLSCPTCRAPLPPAAPGLQRQLSAYLCRARQLLDAEPVSAETSEEWEARRRDWECAGRHPNPPMAGPTSPVRRCSQGVRAGRVGGVEGGARPVGG
jgi:hypothetical protein